MRQTRLDPRQVGRFVQGGWKKCVKNPSKTVVRETPTMRGTGLEPRQVGKFVEGG